MYENCKIYGPYISKDDSRSRMVIINEDKQRKTLSYPRYLMELALNRYLTEEETVDHIDGNVLNNELNNLQILLRQEHCILDAIRNEDITVTCTYCGKIFTIEGSKIVQRNRKDKHQSGYFCSRQCTGRYGADIQNKILTHQVVEQIVPNKTKWKDCKDYEN